MPRLDTWIKTRVLTLIKPRQKKLTTKDITISNPIPPSHHHWSPVMRSPPQPLSSRWSVSAEDLLLPSRASYSTTSSTPSLTHSRDSSNSSGITIVVHSPPPSTPPPNYFPDELILPTRSMWASSRSPSPTPVLILPPSPPLESCVLFSETPSPKSYFKTGFDFDFGLMGAESVLSEGEMTDVERVSYVEERPTRRMSLGIDMLRSGAWEYNRI
jgi:hypothetical protein